jgi:hypothetical protein
MSNKLTPTRTKPSPKTSTQPSPDTCIRDLENLVDCKSASQGSTSGLLLQVLPAQLVPMDKLHSGQDALLILLKLHVKLTITVSKTVSSNLLLNGSNSKIRLSQLAILIRESHRTSSFSSLLSSSSRLQLK